MAGGGHYGGDEALESRVDDLEASIGPGGGGAWTRVDAGDFDDAYTFDLDGASNVALDGVLTEDCTITVEGLSAGCHFEIWPVQDPVDGGWALEIAGGDLEDPVPVTIATEPNGVSRIGGYSPDGTALYLDLASTGGGGGGGGGGGAIATVTPITDFGTGVSSPQDVPPGTQIDDSALPGPAYEIRGDWLRLTGYLTIDASEPFHTAWERIFSLPIECLFADLTDYVADVGNTQSDVWATANLAVHRYTSPGIAEASFQAFVYWSRNGGGIGVIFEDPVYDEGGPTTTFTVCLDGLEWRIVPPA